MTNPWTAPRLPKGNSTRRSLFWVSFGGSSPTADSNLDDRTRSSERSVHPSNQLLLTTHRTDPWQTDALGANPDSVTKTEHKLKGSGIIASRHRQTVSNKLTAGNLKQKEVVNQRNFIRHQPRKQENFRFPKDSENCSCDLTIWPILESLFVLVPTLLLTQHSNKTR